MGKVPFPHCVLSFPFRLRLNELSQGLSVRYVAGDGHEHPRALISGETSDPTELDSVSLLP